MEQSLDLLSNNIELNSSAESNLLDAARWGKFLAIVGFVMCVLIVVLAFFIGYILSNSVEFNANPAVAKLSPVVTIVYLVIAVIQFFPCLFLFKFSAKMQRAIKSISQEEFESAIQNLKSMFKFLGVIMIIVISIFFISFLIGVIAAAMK